MWTGLLCEYQALIERDIETWNGDICMGEPENLKLPDPFALPHLPENSSPRLNTRYWFYLKQVLRKMMLILASIYPHPSHCFKTNKQS